MHRMVDAESAAIVAVADGSTVGPVSCGEFSHGAQIVYTALL